MFAMVYFHMHRLRFEVALTTPTWQLYHHDLAHTSQHQARFPGCITLQSTSHLSLLECTRSSDPNIVLSLKQGNKDRRSDLKRCTAFWNVAATQTSSAYIILICGAKVASAHGLNMFKYAQIVSKLWILVVWHFGIVWICLGQCFEISMRCQEVHGDPQILKTLMNPFKGLVANQLQTQVRGSAQCNLSRFLFGIEREKMGEACHISLDFMVQYHSIGLIMFDSV